MAIPWRRIAFWALHVGALFFFGAATVALYPWDLAMMISATLGVFVVAILATVFTWFE
jgi:hypothetical protein